MATEAVIKGIMQQNLPGRFGQAFRGAQTFPLQLQQARQQLAGGEQEQQIGDIWRRLQEAKLAGLPEELKATREQRTLGKQIDLARLKQIQESTELKRIEAMSPHDIKFESAQGKLLHDYYKAVRMFGPHDPGVQAFAKTILPQIEQMGTTDTPAGKAAATFLAEQSKDFSKLISSTNEASSNAIDIETAVKRFMHTRQKLPGITSFPWLGPAWETLIADPKYQEVKNIAADIRLKQAGMQEHFKGGNLGFNLIGQAKLNPTDRVSASRNIADRFLSQTSLVQEKVKFLNALRAKGVNSPAVATALWINFRHQKPVLSETGQFRPENAKKWEEYTTPEAVEAAQAGRNFSPEEVRKNPGIHGEHSIMAKNGLLYPQTELQDMAK